MILPVLLGLGLARAPPVAAEAPPAYSGRAGQVEVALPRLEAQVEIDGVLDEPAWEKAARLFGFSQYAPVDGRPAEQDTEVLVWYSPSAIHFGIKAQAPPDSVRASLANRDHIDADDAILIFLDTFHDGRQALVFEVNPLGVQADGALVEGTKTQGGGFSGLSSGREEPDLNPDYVFDSKGRLTASGYEVEVRIPFKSLRYPALDHQSWGVHVTRRLQSTGHEDSWAPARRAATSFLAQAGTLSGLTDLRPGLVLDLNPVVTAKMDGAPAGGGWAYDAGRPEVGGNVRWGVTSNLTLNGSVNPDFSQVEADASQFTFDPRSALFFPEKRPFFLDGIEQFATPNNIIYTRRVVAPVAAAKLTGKVAGTRLAALFAVDGEEASARGRDHPLFNIVRLQRDLGGQSRLGLAYTDRIDGPASNRVAELDSHLAFGGLYAVDLQAAVSRTSDGVTARTAPLWQAIVSRNGRHFGFRHALVGIDEDFHAASGFISRGAIAHANLDHRVTFFGPAKRRWESLSCDVVLDGIWHYRDFARGPLLERKLHFNNNLALRGGWRAGASVLIERFDYDPGLYTDYALAPGTPGGTEILPFTGTPHLKNLDYLLTLNTPDYSTFSGSLFYIWGKDENFFEWSPADIKYLILTADWRPTEKVRVSAQYQLQSFDRRTDGTTVGDRRIPRLKVEYQLSRAVFFRVVGEYDANRQDTLRDDSRSELPIVLRDPSTGTYAPASAFERNRFRVDWLFSYQPTPGTVVFAGYGSTLTEPEGLRFRALRRASDGFFLKVSYLFRM
jgi:hypothetical protein